MTKSGIEYSAPGPALPPDWLTYRDAFAVLQYMSALAAGEVGVGISWAKLVTELGFGPQQGEELLQYLLHAGCAEYHQGRREVGLTRRALEYLARERGRRRSLRPPAAVTRPGGAAGSRRDRAGRSSL